MIGLQSKRVFLPLLLTLVLVAAASGICWGIIMPSHEVYVYIDGNRLLFPDQQPYVDEMGRTMVPLRHCAQTLGATVNWDQDKQQALVKKPGPNNALTVITLAVGQKQVIIDDVTVKEMDVAPVLRYDRVMVPLRFISEYLGFEVRWDGKARSAHVFTRNQSEAEKMQIINDTAKTVKELPRVNSAENLQRLLNESNASVIGIKRLAIDAAEAEVTPQNAKSAANFDTAAKWDEYSETNVQVQGVDEADIIKTDGKYIYMIKNNSVQVIKAFPAEQMAVASQIELKDRPREIYIDADRLIIINDVLRYNPYPLPLPEKTTMVKRISYYPGQTSIEIYNTLDKSQPVLVDEYVLGGSYVSSRKIDNKVYVITSEHIYQPYEPVYYINGQPKTKSYQEICYFPDIIHNSYLHLGQIILGDSNQINVETFLGSGNNIYCSQDNLYVAAQHYYPRLNDYAGSAGENTLLYKFAVKDKIEYKARGMVPGTLLNQFSMDEYDSYFRVATTQKQQWSSVGSSNAVYILDSNLEQVSSIEDIAPGERIYSARFMEDRAYLVTFEQLDPFFVLDMNPKQPKVLGKLKIPGFSNYLHPFGENRVIGLGKEVVDSKWGLREAGVKLSMFDVSNVNDPLEIHKEIIGSYNSSSPATHDHKAFLSYGDLVAFPVTVYESSEGNPSNAWFEFQGVYVYQVLKDGFQYKGRITHLDSQDYLKAGQYWRDGSKEVKRVLCIGDTLYSLSDTMIKANQIQALREINSLMLP